MKNYLSPKLNYIFSPLRTTHYALLITFCLVFSCSTKKQTELTDTPVSGRIKIVADESLKNLVNAQVQVYEAIYPRTKFDVAFMPEQVAIRKMLHDEARLAITTRGLNKEEQDFLRAEQFSYIPGTMALDAVALVVNRSQKDTTISITELKDLVKNKKTTLVFDNNNSSNLTYMIDRLAIKDIKETKVFSANNNKEVIEYVKKNTNVIGVVGLNWISDTDNLASRALNKSIRVLAVKDDAKPAMSNYAQPTPQNLRWRRYALERKVYMLTKEGHSGLGRGFIRFASSQKGQLIVEKEGLQPFYLYRRNVKFERYKIN